MISVDIDTVREELTDLFARMHHSMDVARSRAEAVIALLERHAQAQAEVDTPGERVACCFACGWRELAPSLRPAVQKMADHSIEAGCSFDDLLVIPADRMHLLK